VESDYEHAPPPPEGGPASANVPVLVARVEFAPASKSNKSDARRVQINALYFAALGIWSVGLALTSEPVYGTLAAIVLLEFALAFFRIARLTGQVVGGERTSERLTPILIELCAKAKCEPPRVVLRTDARCIAAVRQRKGRFELLLLHQFVEAVSDRELRALVAHEVIHIVHNDIKLAKVRSVVGLVGGFGLGTAIWIAAGYEIKNLPIFLAAFMLGVLLIRVLLSPLNRRREIRADVEGVALSGDATAAADALTIAYAQSTAARERLYGRPPWRWLLSPLDWRMPTHPQLADRVARLRALSL